MLFVILSSTLPRIGQVASPFLLGIFRLKKKKKSLQMLLLYILCVRILSWDISVALSKKCGLLLFSSLVV